MSQALQDSRNAYANGYYTEKLEEGLVFQDVVTRDLFQRGIVVVGYASRRFQMKHGENMLGAEIKRDNNFRKTFNLYIETAEKAHPDRPTWTPSGIHREDNAWLYVIGDETRIWIFSTKYLRMLEKRYDNRQRETPTSQGFLMPVVDADKYCLRSIDIQAK